METIKSLLLALVMMLAGAGIFYGGILIFSHQSSAAFETAAIFLIIGSFGFIIGSFGFLALICLGIGCLKKSSRPQEKDCD